MKVRWIGMAVWLCFAGAVQPCSAEQAASVDAAAPAAAGSAAAKASADLPPPPAPAAPAPASATSSAAVVSTPAPEDPDQSLRSRLDFAKGLYVRDMYDMAFDEYEAILRDAGKGEAASEALIGSGESLFFLKRYADARERFETFVKRFPESPESEKARLRTGETLLYDGQKQEAFTVFHDLRGAKNDTVRIAARYYEGKISFDQGFLNAAATHFREVIDAVPAGPYTPFAQYYLGEVLLSQNAAEEAAKRFSDAAASENPEVRQLAHMGAGKALASLGRFEDAAQAFQAAGAQGPDEKVAEDAILNRMNALANAERFDELNRVAEEEKSRIQDPQKQVEFKLLAAKGLSRSGQKEAAQGIYKEVMKVQGLKPEEARAAKLGVAQNMIAQGQAGEALAFLASEDAAKNLPADEILFLKAEAFRKLGRKEEAQAAYGSIAAMPASDFKDEAMLAQAYLYTGSGDFAKAAEAFRTFLAAFPDTELTPKAFADLILCEIKLKDYAKAIEDSQRFMDRYPSGPETQKVHLRMAGLYTETGRYPLAAETYDNHVRRFADSVNAKEIELLRAFNAQRAGDVRGALKTYLKISARDVSAERYAELLRNRAFAYISLERYRPAAETYLRLFRSFGDFADDPQAYLWTADVLAHSGSVKKLEETMDLFQKKFGDAAYPVEAAYYRAEIDRLAGRSEKAVAGYERVMASGGGLSARAAFGKGLTLAAKGNGPAAEAALEDALKLAGEDHRLAVQVRMELGQMYLDSKNYKEAAKTFFAIAILYDDPQTVPRALWGAGQAFEKAKDTEKAAQAYRELGERYPQHTLAREADKRLKALV